MSHHADFGIATFITSEPLLTVQFFRVFLYLFLLSMRDFSPTVYPDIDILLEKIINIFLQMHVEFKYKKKKQEMSCH